MANKKITDYTELTAPHADDLSEMVDVSDTTQNAAGSSVKVKQSNIIKKAHGLSDGVVKVSSGVMTSGDIDGSTDITGVIPIANLATGTPNGSKFIRDDGTLQTVGGGGDALTSNPLSQFASTTSLQLKGVLSDETGSGAAVFANSPALVTPTGIVKGDVGLGNVDNTSDANKPVSSAQQTAIDAKVDDTAYDATSWNGVTTVAPSKNAIRDKLESLSSGGQSTFTFIVAPSGGDYTTLSAAIAAASAGDSIFVKAGTYSEGGWTSSLANITVVGQNAINTILNFDANAITHTGANLKLIGLTLNSTTATFTLTSTDLQIDRCILAKTSGTNNFLVSSATNLRFTNNKFTNGMAVADNKIGISFTGAKTYMTNNYIETSSSSTSRGAIRVGAEAKVIGNTFHVVNGSSGANYCLETGANTIISSNRFTESGNFTGTFIAPEGANIVINNNNLVNTNSVGNAIAPIAAFSNLNIDGNYIQVRRGIVTAGTTTNYWRITNNYILGTIAGSVIYVYDVCAGFVITGNYIGGPASSVAIDIDGVSANAGRHLITGNYFDTPTSVTMAQDNNLVSDNIGTATSILNDRKVVWMKNTSGGTLSPGAVVTFKSVAAGNEITTTTTGGDAKVFGVVTMSVTNNAFGPIQITGKTTLLTVNGTTDIAIGDHLSTYTTAGIAKKASAGETVFAIALEAYTTDDSNGVIDALLIPTRMI